jgi:hypothetical protein
MSKKLKISMVKSWICKDAEGKQRLSKLYKNPTVTERLQENQYSYETNY